MSDYDGIYEVPEVPALPGAAAEMAAPPRRRAWLRAFAREEFLPLAFAVLGFFALALEVVALVAGRAPALTALVAFVGGCFATAGLAHRRARLDAEALLYLSEHPGAYGLELIHARVCGGRGSIYVRLSRLEDKGLLTSAEEAGGPERRYCITHLGIAWLAIEARAWQAATKPSASAEAA